MINKELLKEIKEYCKLNDLIVRDIINIALIRGFDIEKFGLTPTSANKERKPVEVIKIVEKVVEKIVKVSDDTKSNKLLKEIEELQEEIENSLDNIEKLEDEIFNLKREVKNCNDNSKKDIYGE